ncbi:hypothetical protein FOMPIDRAFT_1120664, partial [Fomitopsis schrenkii]
LFFVDILNLTYPSCYSRRPTAVAEADPTPKDITAHVRHLAKYVFPRQYGLSHPFIEHERTTFQSHKSPDYSNREEEIKKAGSLKTPNRVKSVLHVLDKLLWKHKKCKYKALLEVVCSSKVRACSRFLLNIDTYRFADQDRGEHDVRQ